MARTPISKNSNSNKTFGFNLNIKNKGKTIINDVLKYKKKVSSSIRPDENGLYYTDAGYWVEEIFSPNNLKIAAAPATQHADDDPNPAPNGISESMLICMPVS